MSLYQRIEQLNCADLAGTTVTLSADLANSVLTSVSWAAYYANTADSFGTLVAATKTLIATGTFTVSSSIARYSTNISIPAAATTGIEIVFTVGAQTSGTWTIGDVQLEAGTIATPFERIDYSESLRRCQRYCYAMRSFDSGQAYFRFPAGYTAGLSAAVSNVFFPVEMRSTPSLVSSINWQEIVNNQGNPASGTTVTLVTDGGNRFQMPLVFSNSAGAFSGAGALSAIRVNNSITWSLIFNAEL